MKFTLTKTDLLDSLKIVSRAVNNQNALPVLGNILIEAKEGSAHFSATNLELSISTSCSADIKSEGSLTVPAKILTSYTSLLGKSTDITLARESDDSLSVVASVSKTKIKGISSEEFPAIAIVENGEKISFPAKDFHEAIEEVAFAAQENSSRPILAGVYLHGNEDSVAFVATDSYRLSEKNIKPKIGTGSVKCVIPVRAIAEASRLSADDKKGLVDIKMSDNQAMFTIGKTRLITRLIEGVFPDYHQIIPKKASMTAVVDREDFSLAVRRVSIFAKENNQHMRLEFTNDGKLSVSTDTTQVGEEKTELNITIDGETSIIALNTDYVLEALAVIKSKDIQIELDGKLNPAVFKNEKSSEFIHLIMPLKA